MTRPRRGTSDDPGQRRPGLLRRTADFVDSLGKIGAGVAALIALATAVGWLSLRQERDAPDKTTAAGQPKHTATDVHSLRFRTPQEAAYCVRAGEQLKCWTPNDGFTVVVRATSTATKSYVEANRGFVENDAPVLRFGDTWRSGSFVCRSRSDGLTCVNQRGHGWWIGRYIGYRLR